MYERLHQKVEMFVVLKEGVGLLRKMQQVERYTHRHVTTLKHHFKRCEIFRGRHSQLLVVKK